MKSFVIAVVLCAMASLPALANTADPIALKLCKRNPHCTVVKSQQQDDRQRVGDAVRRAALKI